MSTTRGMGGHGSSLIPWCLMLVTGLKSDGARLALSDKEVFSGSVSVSLASQPPRVELDFSKWHQDFNISCLDPKVDF